MKYSKQYKAHTQKNKKLLKLEEKIVRIPDGKILSVLSEIYFYDKTNVFVNISLESYENFLTVRIFSDIRSVIKTKKIM